MSYLRDKTTFDGQRRDCKWKQNRIFLRPKDVNLLHKKKEVKSKKEKKTNAK